MTLQEKIAKAIRLIEKNSKKHILRSVDPNKVPLQVKKFVNNG